MWKNSSRLTWTEKTDYRTRQYLNLLSCLLLPFKSGCAWKSPWCQNTGPLQWCVFIVFQIAHPAFRTDRRLIGLLRFEGISLSHLVQPPCLRVVSESWLSRSVCRWFFISRDTISATNLGNLDQSLVALTGTLERNVQNSKCSSASLKSTPPKTPSGFQEFGLGAK